MSNTLIHKRQHVHIEGDYNGVVEHNLESREKYPRSHPMHQQDYAQIIYTNPMREKSLHYIFMRKLEKGKTKIQNGVGVIVRQNKVFPHKHIKHIKYQYTNITKLNTPMYYVVKTLKEGNNP